MEKAGATQVVKIFFLLMIMSYPGQTSVKYHGAIYPSEELCIKARDGYMEGFNNKIGWLTRQAYGYRDEEYLILKIFDLPNIKVAKEL